MSVCIGRIWLNFKLIVIFVLSKLFFFSEYCKMRAFPTINKSEYLNTIGSKLSPEIDVLWTGDKVISQVITTESIIELSKVLRRKPIIWDNIHANDYDHRRVFLGPYSGRPVELYKYLNGVLTNPNCEFEANFVAIHTFATWCQVAGNATKPAVVAENQLDSADLDDAVPMEVQIDETIEVRSSEEPVQIDLYPLTPADVTSVVTSYDPRSAMKLAIQDWLEEFKISKPAEIKCYAKRHTNVSVLNGQTVYSGQYSLDVTNPRDEHMMEVGQHNNTPNISMADLYLLTDLFYLPYEHGKSGNSFLSEFKWLNENCQQANGDAQLFKDKESSWRERAAHFHSHCHMVGELFVKLSKIPNESILYDLYPYAWDVNESVLALGSYVSWLASSEHKPILVETNMADQELSSNEIAAPGFLVEDFIEAWHVKYIGGITVAMLKLLPFDGGFGFLDIAPDSPSSDIYHVRPFHDSDKENLYKLCSVTDCATTEVIDMENEDFYGDKRVGPYLDICAKSVFIVEHNGEICGYVAAAPDNKSFNEKTQSGWLPFMNKKYPKAVTIDNPCARHVDWYLETNSHLEVHVQPKIRTARVMRRVLAMVLSVLKSLGSTSVFMELRDEGEFDMYSKLGFQSIDSGVNRKTIFRPL